MKSKWMKCCAVLMSILLATSPLTALAEETAAPKAAAVEATTEVETPTQEETEAEAAQEESEAEEDAGEEKQEEIGKVDATETGIEENEDVADAETQVKAAPQVAGQNGEDGIAVQADEVEYPTFTVRGKDYTLNSDTWTESSTIAFAMYKTEFKNCNTEEDYADILEQFLSFAIERIKKKDDGSVSHCLMECNQGKDVIASLKIPITDKAYEIIKELKETYNIDFQLLACVKRSDGDDMWTSTKGITEPTMLGFEVYDCLENTNIYFYGKGYQIYIGDVPYTQGGDPILVHAESGKKIASAKEGTMQYSQEGKYVDLPIEVKDSGLYYVMPEATKNDTSKANLVVKSNGDTDKVTTAISGAVATAGDQAEVKVDISEIKDDNGNIINPQIGKAVFEQLDNKKANDAAVTFSYGDLNYKFAAADVTDPDAVETITLGADEATDEVKEKVGDTVAYAIDFAHSGKLPGKATVTIPVQGLADGQYTWCYVNDANQLTEGKLVTVADGKVEVPLEHCSTYALVAGDVTGTTNGDNGNNNGNAGNNGNNDNTGNNNGSNTNNGANNSSSSNGTTADTTNNSNSGSSSSSGSTNRTGKVADNASVAGSVTETTGKNVQSHTIFWTLSDSYKQSLTEKIDKTKAPGQVKWFYDVTVDEVNFPLTLTVNVKGLNGKRATIVRFKDGNTPEYITPSVKGDQATFTLNAVGPIAIVVDSTQAAGLVSPRTVDNADFGTPLMLLIFATAGLIGCVVYSRRKRQAS